MPAQGIGIVALVSQYRIGVQTVQQRLGLRNIGHLVAGQQPAYRIAQRIDDCMNLARQSATRASNAFYDRAEATLRELNLSPRLSRDECKVVDEFSGLDFGAEPCAGDIQSERAKK